MIRAFYFAEFAAEKHRMNKITYRNHQRSKIYSSVFFYVENENRYEKCRVISERKLETFGNKYFQKVPSGGKKL